MTPELSHLQPDSCPVDAHVHLHRKTDVGATLDSAAANFARVRGADTGLLGYLLLTQAAHELVFEALEPGSSEGDWLLVRAEPQTLLARNGERMIALVCGRQAQADDGLEVAALGTLERFDDGLPFGELLRAVMASDAVAAIPWGFGKWTGTRARRVAAEMARQDPARYFLGDSGSRSWAGPEPALIRRARAGGIRVLAGTDPFPFAGDFRRVGSFGFVAELEPDPEQPWARLRSWLAAVRGSPRLYGRPAGPVRFLVNQLGVHVHNFVRHWKAE